MTDAETQALIRELIDEVRAGRVPDLDVLPQEAKDTLLRVATLFEPEWTVEAVAAVLPELRTEDDVEAFRLSIRFFKGARISYRVFKFFYTPLGAVIAVIAASVLTGISPLEVLSWANSVKP